MSAYATANGLYFHVIVLSYTASLLPEKDQSIGSQ